MPSPSHRAREHSRRDTGHRNCHLLCMLILLGYLPSEDGCESMLFNSHPGEGIGFVIAKPIPFSQLVTIREGNGTGVVLLRV